MINNERYATKIIWKSLGDVERTISSATFHDRRECSFDMTAGLEGSGAKFVTSNVTREAAAEIISVLSQFLVDTAE